MKMTIDLLIEKYLNEARQPSGSGRWKKPLNKFISFMEKNKNATIKQISDFTGLSNYEVKTLSDVFKMNLSQL
jgi:hypothetical protein